VSGTTRSFGPAFRTNITTTTTTTTTTTYSVELFVVLNNHQISGGGDIWTVTQTGMPEWCQAMDCLVHQGPDFLKIL